VGGAGQVIIRDAMWPSSESFAFTACPGDARMNPFPNPFAVEFCEAAQNSQHQPSSGT
jgi:hypothetical protein